MYVSRFKLRFMTLLLSCMLVLPAASTQSYSEDAAKDLAWDISRDAGIFTTTARNKILGNKLNQLNALWGAQSAITAALQEDDEVKRSLALMNLFLTNQALSPIYSAYVAVSLDIVDAIYDVADATTRPYWNAGPAPTFHIRFENASWTANWFRPPPRSKNIAEQLAYVRLVRRPFNSSTLTTVVDNDDMCIATTKRLLEKCPHDSGFGTANKAPRDMGRYSIAMRPNDWSMMAAQNDANIGDEYFLYLCWDYLDSEISEDTGCPEYSVRTVVPLSTNIVMYERTFTINIQFRARSNRQILLDDDFSLTRYKK